jgi:hypothetical protein
MIQSKLVKVSVSFASAALVLGAFAPSVFAADVTISGNGDGSHNGATLTNTTTTTVGQSNVQTVNVVASSNADTGGNEVSHNTGEGGNSVQTGSATAETAVLVTGGSNKATLSAPCGCEDPATVTITDNGDKSHNKVKIKNKKTTTVGQSTVSTVGVSASSKGKTGKNEVEHNTGAGGNTVTTGDASSSTGVVVKGPKNTATL